MSINEILSNLNFKQLTPMQEAMLEASRKSQNIVLLSPTGTGKTLAFLLPLLEMLQKDSKEVEAVILVPSRELALQIEDVFRAMKTSFRAISCYGGRPAMEEHRTMQQVRPNVIIATPGRMRDHLQKENFNANTVRLLIIDEFDKSLELGFHEDMKAIISALPSLKRRFLLSATDSEEIPHFAGIEEENEGKASVKLNFLTEETVEESRLFIYKVDSPQKDKLETLYRLLCVLGAGSTLIFCNHRESVERVTAFLKSRKVVCDMYHGGMEQMNRERALYKFRNGTHSILVSTDLAARGLDIPRIGHIIHYHLPLDKETYTHRNGRTARWEAEGKAFLLMHDKEVIPEYVREEISIFEFPEVIPKPVKPTWTTLYIGKGKKDKINKADIVGFLYKKGNMTHEDIGKVDVKEHYSFVAVRRSKVNQLLHLVRGEKIKGIKTIIEESV